MIRSMVLYKKGKEYARVRRLWLVVIGFILLVGFGFAICKMNGQSTAVSPQETPVTQTTSVQRGDITVSTTGSGVLVTVEQVDLSFKTAGRVRSLFVEVGDQVLAGDVLATLDEIESLEVAVETKELELKTAQQTLDELLAGTVTSLAEAQRTWAEAQANYQDALDDLRYQGDMRCDKQVTEQYYYDYMDAQGNVDVWESYLNDGSTGYGEDYILVHLAPYRKERDQAYTNLKYCQGYTEREIRESEAELDVAKAELSHAEAVYEELKATYGLDQDAAALAEATANNAVLQLEIARNALNGAVITAPMDGTILSIAEGEGEEVGTSTFLTLANLEQAALEIYIDETDLLRVKIGSTAEVIFDSIPDRTFHGEVVQLEPMLASVDGYDMIKGLVHLDEGILKEGQNFLLGMGAAVEVISSKAQYALLVPVEALIQQENGQYAVYVVAENGGFEKRELIIGLVDYTFAEVISGLKEGELVSTKGVEINP